MTQSQSAPEPVANLQARIAKLEQDNQQLQAEMARLRQATQERVNLLNAIAQVANLLLRSPDYTTVLPDVVQLLREAVGSDRCTITQDTIQPISEQLAVKVLAEWNKPSIATTADLIPSEAGFIVETISLEFHEPLLRGEVLNFLVADLSEPMRSVFAAQGNTSMLIMPIMVQGQCWGEIGFDNCAAPRLYNAAEIAILKIAADSLAAAIERQAKDDELRRSEALYRSLFEISNEGIYRWELDRPVSLTLPLEEQVEQIYRQMHMAQANDAYAAMYGFAKGEDAIGFRLSEAHVADSEKNRAFMRATVENGYCIRNVESEELHANGQRCYFLNSVISFIESNCVMGGWGTQIDITELRQAQQAILQAEQDRAALLKTVTTVANQLLRSTDYTMVIADVLQILGEAARADRCSLIQNITAPDTGKPAAQIYAEWCSSGIQSSISHTPDLVSALSWELFPDGYITLAEGKTLLVLVNDLAEPVRSLMLAQGNVSMLMVPIVVQDEFWGVFGFDYCQEEQCLDEVNAAIFAIAVDSIAAAIDRQQKDRALLQAERSRAAELVKTNDILNKTLDTLATEPELNRFLRHISRAIAERMNAPDCLLWLFDESLETATLHLSHTTDRVNFPVRSLHANSSHPICLHHSNWAFCTDNRQPYQIDVTTSSFTTASYIYLNRLGIKVILIVPLWLGDRLIGSFAVRLPKVRAFTHDLDLVQALARQATLALQLMKLTEQASHSAVLEERNRMAREIHDVLAQAFTGVIVNLEAAKMVVAQDTALLPLIAQAQDLARTGLAEARRSVWSLRPEALENTDLRSALAQLVQTLAHQTSVQIQLQIQGIECEIAPEMETHLLRIAQEALTNAIAHARANRIQVELKFDTTAVRLCVCDDGQGFDPMTPQSHHGFGLVSMQERADCINGEFTLTSQPGAGTSVVVTMPCQQRTDLNRGAQ